MNNLYADDDYDFEAEELDRFRFDEPGRDGGREHVMVCGERTALAIREELNATPDQTSDKASSVEGLVDQNSEES